MSPSRIRAGGPPLPLASSRDPAGGHSGLCWDTGTICRLKAGCGFQRQGAEWSVWGMRTTALWPGHQWLMFHPLPLPAPENRARPHCLHRRRREQMVLHHEHHFILALGKTPRVCKALLYMFPSFSPARVGIPIIMILQNSAILKWHVSLNLQITDYSHFIQTIAKHGKKWDAMQFIFIIEDACSIRLGQWFFLLFFF